MALPAQVAHLMDAAAPYLTTPVLAGSALALLLTLLALSAGLGRPKSKGRRAVKAQAKPVASPKAKAIKPTPAKVTKAPPTTPGDDVRRSARCVRHMPNFEDAPRLLTPPARRCRCRPPRARPQGAQGEREGHRR